jgi:hypothetical protein
MVYLINFRMNDPKPVRLTLREAALVTTPEGMKFFSDL